MKTSLARIGFALAFSVVLAAQTPGKPGAKLVAVGPSAQALNEDLNIRAYIELLRSDVKNEKSQIIGQVMRLDAEQSAKFWPLYKDFEANLTRLGDETFSLINKYAENYEVITSAVADQLALKFLDIEQRRNELKKTYYAKIRSALGAITAARFLQVENQMERLIDLQIAAELPVIE